MFSRFFFLLLFGDVIVVDLEDFCNYNKHNKEKEKLKKI